MSEESLEDVIVTVGDDELDLATLANVDMSDIAEKRAGGLPIGGFRFELLEIKLGSFTMDDDDAESGEREVASINIPCKVLGVHGLRDKSLDPQSLVGKIHTHSVPVFDAESLGFYVAFMNDIGYTGEKKINVAKGQAVGTLFDGVIMHKRRRNDPDNPRVQLDPMKVKPVAAPTENVAAE